MYTVLVTERIGVNEAEHDLLRVVEVERGLCLVTRWRIL